MTDTENVIRVEVYTENSISVRESFIAIELPETINEGDLYILAIGVNHIENIPVEKSIDLAYAAQDAQIFSKVLDDLSQYENKYIKLLNDFTEIKPYKQNILDSLEFLENSGPNDTVIVFLASHGISNEAGDYFMVPRDATMEDIEGVLGANHLEAESLVKWNQIVDGIRNSSGKRFLIVDTCQAQKIEGNFDFGSLAKRSSAMSFGLLAASKGDEVAQEYPPGEQGLFSYSLVQALQGNGDLNDDNVIDISEMYRYAVDFVSEK